MLWLSAIAAACAGACFAAAGVLQQRVAATRTPEEDLSPRLLVDLARQRVWLAGIGLAVLSYGFQSVALTFGPLALVQPVLVSELVFAVPISVRLHHQRLGGREWAGIVAVAGGLTTALVAGQPSEGDARASGLGWAVTVSAVAVAAGVALLAGRRFHGPVQASTYAFAGAAVMGSQSALLAVTLRHLRSGFLPLVSSWQTYLLIIASIVGLLLIQSAYQAGPLAASMPVIDAVEPLVAVSIGLLLFGERFHTGAVHLVLAGVGAVAVLAGIVLLDTSPVLQRLHQKEEQEREESVSANG